MSCAVDGVLRVVHVRIFDPPVRGAGRFFPESRADATAVLEHALLDAWECGSRVSGEVVVAERSHLAMAIVSAAQGWDAGVIVLAAAGILLTALFNRLERVLVPWNRA